MYNSKYEEKDRHVLATECYMKDYDVSREKTIEELLKICENAWKDMTKESMSPTPVPMRLLTVAVMRGRIMGVMYKSLDTYTNSSNLKHHVFSVSCKMKSSSPSPSSSSSSALNTQT